MTVWDELKARGLIAQVTDEEEIKEMVNNGKATFYIGFDPTADSLHVGHFMALCLMKRLQMAGNKPIALLGGGTGMIGDPSGRSDMRQMMTVETIQHNIDCFKKQMERFIDFSDGKALMVNNADWLMNLNYVEVLRDVGPHFSVNRMLSHECYKQRMERGLTFLEFNYMIMQSYDFYMLYQKYGCTMQFGGDDQWANMLGGTELIRRKLGKDAYAMTITLLLNSEEVRQGIVVSTLYIATISPTIGKASCDSPSTIVEATAVSVHATERVVAVGCGNRCIVAYLHASGTEIIVVATSHSCHGVVVTLERKGKVNVAGETVQTADIGESELSAFHVVDWSTIDIDIIVLLVERTVTETHR